MCCVSTTRAAPALARCVISSSGALARDLHECGAVDTSKRWIERGARLGHLTKGILYGLIGALALQVAFGAGGQVAGGQEAARFIGNQPFGQVLLVLLGVGMSGYALWRFIEGIQDTEHKGRSGAGLAARLGSLASGFANGALALAAFQMAFGEHDGPGAKSWIGKLLAQPFGEILVGLVGAGIVIAGLVQFYKVYSKSFLEEFRVHAMSADERRWITRMGQVGYSARGVVFPIIGAGLLRAAFERDPSEARGTREALLDIARSSEGQILLALVAAGFLAFGAFMVASARYRDLEC